MVTYKRMVRMVEKKPRRDKKILTDWYNEEYKCYLKHEYQGDHVRMEEKYERVR